MKILSLLYILFSFAFSSEVYVHWGLGFTQYQAKEFNRMMELLAKRSSDSTAGFNNFEIDEFNGHPYQVFEIGAYYEQHRLALELEYWVESFAQNSISFYTQRHLDDRITGSLNCQFLADPNFEALTGSITGCVYAQETFTFLPLTLGYSYVFWQNDFFKFDLGVGLGYFLGKANIKVRTDYFAGRVNGDQIDFDLDIGHNPIFKLQSSFSYQPLSFLGLEFRVGYRYSQIEHLKVTNVKGSSEIFQIVMGKPIESGQKVYIESYPGLSSAEDELSLLKDSDKFKSSDFYNSVQGQLNGLVLSLRIQLSTGMLFK